MTVTPGQQQNLPPKHVSSTSSIDTLINDSGSHQHNAMQPVVSHQSLNSTISPRASPSGPQSVSQNPPTICIPPPDTIPSAPPPKLVLTHVQIQPSTGVIVESTMPTANTVPEFLYQLTKMLTDNNRDIIEWSNGKIEVHNPHKLQSHVLNRYFRHSKFASFQRQLNYFGFRKLAGKGKMAPCSYVNDGTTKDLGSLLIIKRKVGNEPTNTKPTKKRDRDDSIDIQSQTVTNPALTSVFLPSGSNNNLSSSVGITSHTRIYSQPPPNKSQQELARVAVGKGIRHGFSLSSSSKPAPLPARPLHPLMTQSQTQEDLPQGNPASTSTSRASHLPTGIQEGLSALQSNYMNSLGTSQPGGMENTSGSTHPISSGEAYVPGSLDQDDALVDLAMIPLLEDSNDQTDSLPFTFIDFPWQDPDNSTSNLG